MSQFATFEEENIDYWTKRAPGYSDVNQEELSTRQKIVWRSLLLEKITKQFPDKDPKELKILDLGCGPGFFSIILSELGYSVTAVDYTFSMLEEAKKNAGENAKEIMFIHMNVEDLDFLDETFDVVISRNVSWNLKHPKTAYSEWVRVLKNGGLFLNFDANWYHYLWDEDASFAHKMDRKNLKESDVRDETAGTDVIAMESIAKQAPLSARMRPAWDLKVLDEMGLQAEADSEIWRRVWTKEEHINNASTPMFLIEGRKF